MTHFHLLSPAQCDWSSFPGMCHQKAGQPLHLAPHSGYGFTLGGAGHQHLSPAPSSVFQKPYFRQTWTGKPVSFPQPNLHSLGWSSTPGAVSEEYWAIMLPPRFTYRVKVHAQRSKLRRVMSAVLTLSYAQSPGLSLWEKKVITLAVVPVYPHRSCASGGETGSENKAHHSSAWGDCVWNRVWGGSWGRVLWKTMEIAVVSKREGQELLERNKLHRTWTRSWTEETERAR